MQMAPFLRWLLACCWCWLLLLLLAPAAAADVAAAKAGKGPYIQELRTSQWARLLQQQMLYSL